MEKVVLLLLIGEGVCSVLLLEHQKLSKPSSRANQRVMVAVTH